MTKATSSPTAARAKVASRRESWRAGASRAKAEAAQSPETQPASPPQRRDASLKDFVSQANSIVADVAGPFFKRRQSEVVQRLYGEEPPTRYVATKQFYGPAATAKLGPTKKERVIRGQLYIQVLEETALISPTSQDRIDFPAHSITSAEASAPAASQLGVSPSTKEREKRSLGLAPRDWRAAAIKAGVLTEDGHLTTKFK